VGLVKVEVEVMAVQGSDAGGGHGLGCALVVVGSTLLAMWHGSARVGLVGAVMVALLGGATNNVVSGCNAGSGVAGQGWPGRIHARWIHAVSGWVADNFVMPGWRSAMALSTCSVVSLMGLWLSWQEGSAHTPQKM